MSHFAEPTLASRMSAQKESTARYCISKLPGKILDLSVLLATKEIRGRGNKDGTLTELEAIVHYAVEIFRHANVHYDVEPLVHANVYTLYRQPFWHANVHYDVEPFWHAIVH